MQTVVAATMAANPSSGFSLMESAAIQAMTDFGFDVFRIRPRQNQRPPQLAVTTSVSVVSADRAD
jgi:hypothetical protein